MEAGKVVLGEKLKKLDLVDAMVAAADDKISDEDVKAIEQKRCPTCGSCSGMFTANSMNCLTEALGLSLPGNGSTLATHADRKRLFVEAGHLVVDLARRYYEQNDESVLPRAIATFEAFENAMTLDIAMGGSTNTVLHLLAAAHEAGVDFTMKDIDRLSRRVPVALQGRAVGADRPHGGRAPGRRHHVDPRRTPEEPVIHANCCTVHSETIGDALDRWDITRTKSEAVKDFYRAAPGGVRTSVAFSTENRWADLDTDRETGCHPLGRARLQPRRRPRRALRQHRRGRLHREDGRRRREHPEVHGRARIFESQDASVKAILSNEIKAGDVVLIRYEGPKGGPGMQEMLYPTSYLKSKGLGKACALVTDGRFSGGTSASRSAIARPRRPRAAPSALSRRATPSSSTSRTGSSGWTSRTRCWRPPRGDGRQGARRLEPVAARPRKVTPALRAYAAMTTSASRGAVRDVSQIEK